MNWGSAMHECCVSTGGTTSVLIVIELFSFGMALLRARVPLVEIKLGFLDGHRQVVDLVWWLRGLVVVAIAARYKGYRYPIEVHRARGVAVSAFRAEPA